eukprot:XP_003725629.2 PREDICTED: uncharacterized protein LOC100891815 [Strongylocentrotus purpuratus]
MMDKLSVNEKFRFGRQAIQLRQLDSDQFPIIVKIIRCDIDGSEIKSKEILRINHAGFERRVLAVDSMKRVWSFPIHTGAKFDIIGKTLESRKSIYMREIVEATEGTSKRPKKIRFSQIETARIRIAGQEPGEGSSDMLSGDFKIKDVTRVQYFAANRLVDDEISPKVVILPSSLDIHVTMATGLIGMPATAMTSYMSQLTREIKSWVNFDMCRGSSDIMLYDGMSKSQRSSKTLEDLAKLRISPKIVRVSTAYHKNRGRHQPKQTTSAGDEGNISGSAMANMMAASRGESFKNSETSNKSALQWLRTANTSNGTTNPISGEEEMSEEERKAMIRARKRLLMSLDDYGYGSEQDTESRNGDNDNNKKETDNSEVDNNVGDNVSNAIKRGVNVESREDASSSSREIDVPIMVEQTDGSTRVVRREQPKRKETTKRFGGLFGSSADASGSRSGGHRNEDAAEPVLRQSRFVPFEMSGSNYTSVSKKWVNGGSGSEQSATTRAVTKRKSNFKFFSLSRSSKLEEKEATKRMSSVSGDVEVDEHISSLMRFLDIQGAESHLD